MKPCATAYSRCRPLLGTFVEVTLDDPSPEAMDAAFSAVENVSRRMSFHDPKSELSRLNRARGWVRVSDALAEVLQLSLELQSESGGRFNVARSSDWSRLDRPGFEVKGSRARRLLPVEIDLGGIAKGYAVDAAVEAIGGNSGIVNAGGDLRVFGVPREVWIRDSSSSMRPFLCGEEAIATSSNPSGSEYLDIPRRRMARGRRTAVARANRCVLADALTKVALLSPKRTATRVAARYGAEVGVFR